MNQLDIGTRCTTTDPKAPGVYGDWKSEGRLCTVVKLSGGGSVVVKFDDGDGWGGGCWNVPIKHLVIEGDYIGYEVDA